MKHFGFVFSLLTLPLFAGPEILLQSGLITPEMIVTLKPELQLTSAQEATMTQIAQALQAEAAPLEKQVRERQRELVQSLRKPETGQEQAAARLDALMEAEAAVKHLHLKALVQLRDVLDPEQQKKALTLASSKQARRAGLESRVREKAARLRMAVDSLGVPPTQAMQKRGGEIEALIRQGEWTAADQALDQLMLESQVDEAELPPPADFSSYEPGDTDVESLKARYEKVAAAAQSLISIQQVKQLLKAKEALEEAKATEDAEAVGRALTWAEQMLKL
ncbi:LTXXQ motif family protein [Prosthecobacter debontii]|uniref:LTXXQ motif family protein n=1 Tax=Prosthecobacter debontii TaxID=48467 RepID=A0A1T4XZ28_9BACT|nr:Spy/CpxP family protein refolding chaperone [Prosthecobacter debontii]SKA94285.1 LTXXQ motif family protein [Prosthecobacter debontii]